LQCRLNMSARSSHKSSMSNTCCRPEHSWQRKSSKSVQHRSSSC
jgi:hypothetical protein